MTKDKSGTGRRVHAPREIRCDIFELSSLLVVKGEVIEGDHGRTVRREPFSSWADTIFRRFRITHLQKTSCPEALRHFWSGHAPSHVSERYTKLRKERDFRLEWAEKIGVGFELSYPVGQPGQLIVMRKSA
jgi:hypothetical protein